MDTLKPSLPDSSTDSGVPDPPSTDDHPPTSIPVGPTKVKFMVSYGGKIHPRPHDGTLSYVGGETKILAVDRAGLRFSALRPKVSAMANADVMVKYQLPGEDLHALVSVVDDEDIDHMMHEYDRLIRAASSKPARLRLFLFPIQRAVSGPNTEPKRDGSGPKLNTTTPPPQLEPYNVDFLFGLDNRAPPPPINDPVHDHEMVSGSSPLADDVSRGSDPQIDATIQELNRLQVSTVEDNNPVSDFQNPVGNLSSPPQPMNSVSSIAVPAAAYWPPTHQEKTTIANGAFQAVYMIPAPVYHSPMVRPVNRQPAGQGFYQMQRFDQQFYQPPFYYAAPATATANGEVKPVGLAGEGKITATQNLPTVV